MTTGPKYVCPMHPEITSDRKDNCSICGMALVREGDQNKHGYHSVGSADIDTGWRSYIPLFVIFILLIIVATITSTGDSFGEIKYKTFLLRFMTGFCLVFGGFKLLELKSCADGYSAYDLIAARWHGYGYIYPFIEIAFGFIMLAGFHPDWLLWIEFALMTFSGIGVAIKVSKREPFTCVCLGTFLKVPLTYVTLIEDFGMAAIALTLIII